MVLLGVNIDHIATLRQQRLAGFPSPVEAALRAEKAGADGITCHLREDRRHIQEHDVWLLRKKIKTKLNLEMACTDFMVRFACKVKPDNVCLVPEKRRELTTEGGLDVVGQKMKIKRAIERLKKAGICVSIFIDPKREQIFAAKDLGANCVELHTGAYADAKLKGVLKQKSEFRKLKQGAEYAKELGLILNAGHGLTTENVVPVAKIKGMNELNIGFSIVARAVFVGITQAVQEMKSLLT